MILKNEDDKILTAHGGALDNETLKYILKKYE